MASGSAMMSFAPINRIHQHICAFHVYAQDPKRHVEAHHFCTHHSEDFHQCIIYDSGEPDARLIGIEYIVSEKASNGVLQLEVKNTIPTAATDVAEQPAMLELQQTYGKTIHTWAYDLYPELPLGPPNLMMSYTADGQGPPPEILRARDERVGMDTEAKKRLRAGYLPEYQVAKGADSWQTTGKNLSFELKEQDRSA
ncbi:hypothetical protein EIP86_002329 [Pleurotus ostreatoroseus]|nr:hypothetical protein EIP86_002329 [Pleurotus ostreatoroseus]